jgi:hypothetical protein
MEYLLSTANVLYLLAYVVRDMLMLRVLTVVAASMLTAYLYLQPEPLVMAACWNLVFVILNAVWAYGLIKARRAQTGTRGNAISIQPCERPAS